MKIAIATPILYDEKSAFNHLFKDILGGFLDAGHKVTRLVAVRNDDEQSYKYGYDDIEYIKFKRKESSHSNIISRYILDTITNIKQANKLKVCEADVLFEDVSYSSFWAVRAAKKRGMRVVAMLQDVWPDNAVQSGLIKENGILYKYFEMWQMYVYRKADRIICISDDMKQFIASKGIDPSKIKVIYNWGYSDEIVNIHWEKNEFVKKYNLRRDIFYVIYAGNIGRMQNVELIVEAAKKLKDEKNIRFLIVGDGAHKESIEKTICNYELKNINLLPMQPKAMATSVYSAAGINIITLVEGGLKSAFPSKTGVVMSCNSRVICTFGENTCFTKQIRKYPGIHSIGSNCVEDMIKIIKMYVNNGDRCDSAQCFADFFCRSHNINKYIKSVEEVCDESILY